jgi:hypothetical protein
MPRFIPNGPFVPDRLVQDLEDDRVIIFCGAGISMGAGLPDYNGLVEYCYTELGATLPGKKAPDWNWPDRMLGALENRFGSKAVRDFVSERLSQRPADLSFHQAILKLAHLRRVIGTRLVTTNFDTYFEQARSGMHLGSDYHSAPVLPIPRNDRISSWRSIVYLHGRLDSANNENTHLVLTSADFGKAYLTDAWAARFVARLFADFTVLFIGYSLNDPVLRYMTDAFAAEDALTRAAWPRGPAYIFVPHRKVIPDPQAFRDRKLEPIFYNQIRGHTRLRKTLIAWARAREDYLAQTRVLISRIAPNKPASLDPSDTANLLWAVLGRADETAHGANVFAHLKNRPPVEWLDEFERFERSKLDEYQQVLAEASDGGWPTPARPTLDVELLFPALDADGALSRRAHELADWLALGLDDVGLVERIVKKLGAGRCLHLRLRDAIRRRLAQGPALPDGLNLFWRMVSSEGIWMTRDRRMHPADRVRGSYALHAAEPWLRQELISSFRPIIELKPSFYRQWQHISDPLAPAQPIGQRLSELVDVEVILSDQDRLDSMIAAVNGQGGGDAYWSTLLYDLTGLLRQVLDLYALAGEATVDYDASAMQRPSIVPHPQNHSHHSWTKLFDLIWRGWTYVDAHNGALSKRYVLDWLAFPYLAFRRLAAAAIRISPHFTPQEKLQALTRA